MRGCSVTVRILKSMLPTEMNFAGVPMYSDVEPGRLLVKGSETLRQKCWDGIAREWNAKRNLSKAG